ncbi:uncharacterized protein redic1 isoform X1 [Stigmatopora argus]
MLTIFLKMNWVGGSRHRLMMRNDAIKQREFFEKRRMQNKLNIREVETSSSPKTINSSPKTSSTSSLDLVSHHVANQITKKKEVKDRLALVVRSKGGKKQGTNHLILPMSPGSPSRLSLDESQSQCRYKRYMKSCPTSINLNHVSLQGEMRRDIPPGSKIQESLVVERSSLNPGTPDYTPHFADSVSFFTSSPHLSGHAGRIIQQEEHAQLFPRWSPRPWEGTNLDQNMFPPFSEPEAMTKDFMLSSTPAIPLTSIFGPQHAAMQDLRSENPFMNHVSQFESPVDFTQKQRESKQQCDEDIFEGFLYEDNVDDQPPGLEKTNTYLDDDASNQAFIPQTVPEAQPVGTQLPDGSFNFTYRINNRGYSATSPLRRGYLSSEFSDDADCDDQLGFAQRAEVCQCNKAANEMTDAETQTLYGSTLQLRHVATQCSLLTEAAFPGQQEATREHTGCKEAPLGEMATKCQQNLSKKKSNSFGIFQKSHKSKPKMSLQSPFQMSKIFKSTVVKRTTLQYGNSGKQQIPLEESSPKEARQDQAMNPVEVETREIADILLLLKQRNQGKY